ncbi:hypothetical protein G4B88_013890 [Cannabis sativa]|uniref:GH3 C-terminal domain-containing protein n=1 Tax=Cannabis sativa TaxID=3483 RepID=A0A7J6I1U9_CANSA|nr:hypothetical protein G4B88_013890 [Cannabis sativa]
MQISMLEKMEEFNGDIVIDEFEALTADVERVQRETLKQILEENESAEYLQNSGLNGRTDPESYKSCVPIVTHKELEPYIMRIADGETSPILTGKPITTISLSSGTTQGKPKFVPFNDELMDSTMQIYRTSFAFRNREFPIRNGKALQFIYSSKQFKTKGGQLAGTATTNVFRNSQYKKTMMAIQSECCSPDEVIFGPDFRQSLYCHFLCGLIFRDEIQLISSTFAHSIVHSFRTLEKDWEELCTNIRDGVLSSWITTPSVRAAMGKLLKPNPELANLIYDKCSSLSNWYGLVPALFPNVKYIYGIMTGSMEPYLAKLRHYAGELGDVVKVMGFHNSTPELKFVCRRNLLLTVNIDKNTEKDLQLAVEEAAKLLAGEKQDLVDFTSHVDMSTDPGHYVIFWELSGEASEEILGECCNCLDKSFVDAGYISSRKVNTIGALELRVVRKGTFQKLMDHYLALGSAVSQFKTPRYVGPTNNVVLQILCSNVVKTYLSTAY